MSHSLSEWVHSIVQSDDPMPREISLWELTGAPSGVASVKEFIDISVAYLKTVECSFGESGRPRGWLPYVVTILTWNANKTTDFVDFMETQVSLESTSIGISKDWYAFFWGSWEIHQISMSLKPYGYTEYRLVQRSYINDRDFEYSWDAYRNDFIVFRSSIFYEFQEEA